MLHTRRSLVERRIEDGEAKYIAGIHAEGSRWRHCSVMDGAHVRVCRRNIKSRHPWQRNRPVTGAKTTTKNLTVSDQGVNDAEMPQETGKKSTAEIMQTYDEGSVKLNWYGNIKVPGNPACHGAGLISQSGFKLCSSN